jgi:hypothetical protein
VKHFPLLMFDSRDSDAPAYDAVQRVGVEVSGWDLSYLHFVCEFLGVRFKRDDASHRTVVPQDAVESLLPPGSVLRDFDPVEAYKAPAPSDRR